jgi:hypothetical protein
MVFFISCFGVERPEDDWLSIASAFGWMPVPTQRAVGAHQGASIEVPAAWEVWADPDFDLEAALSSTSELRTTDWLMARDAQTGEGCSLFVWAPEAGAHTELDVEVSGLLADYGADAGMDILTPVPEPISLEAGDARHIRVLSDEGRPPAGITYVDLYLVAGDGVLINVGCSGAVPHHDRWLAIAETLEVLPED